MELRALRSFLAIVDTGSFTSAAERLKIAQPSVSQQIKVLERELGEQLLVRSSAALTAGGEALLPYARATVAAADAASAEFAERHGLLKGTLTIGMVSGAQESILPRILGEYRRRYPGVEIHMFGGPGISRPLVERVRAGGIDAAVATIMTRLEPSLGQFPLTVDRFIALLPKKDPRASRRSLTLEQLADGPLITFSPSTSLRTIIDEACRAQNVELPVPMNIDDVRLQAKLVAEGVGAAITRRDASVESEKGLVVVPIEKPIMYRRSLVWSSKHAPAPLRALIAMLPRDAKPNR